MRLTRFKVISFSCYGTLIDRDSGVYTALQPLLRCGHFSLSRDEVLAKFMQCEALQHAATPSMPYSGLLAEAHRRLAREWSVNLSDDDHALFGKSVANWPIYADAPAALQYLKRYFKLCVLSNADHQVVAASSRRLDIMFDAVFTAREIGAYKPDPVIFEHMVTRLAKLDLARHQILHTAHSLARDQAPAAACGIEFAWIDRPRLQPGGYAAAASAGAAPYDLRFSSLVDMVRAHQEQLQS